MGILCLVSGVHPTDDAPAGESIGRDPWQGIPGHSRGDPQPAGDAASVLPEQARITQH